MLEFIVLGHVPGTNLQLNFYAVVGLTVLGIITAQLIVLNRRHRKLSTPADKTAH